MEGSSFWEVVPYRRCSSTISGHFKLGQNNSCYSNFNCNRKTCRNINQATRSDTNFSLGKKNITKETRLLIMAVNFYLRNQNNWCPKWRLFSALLSKNSAKSLSRYDSYLRTCREDNNKTEKLISLIIDTKLFHSHTNHEKKSIDIKRNTMQ